MTVSGYARISVDLDEDSRENTSIENQKRIIEEYAAERIKRLKGVGGGGSQ